MTTVDRDLGEPPGCTTSILLVDDDDRLRVRLAQAFVDRGFDVETASNHAVALDRARTRAFDRAVVDLRMPGPHGLAVVHDLLALHPAIQIVVVTGYGSIVTAVEAMRIGARDYLTKPAHADQILASFETRDGSDELETLVPSLAEVEREHLQRVLRDCNGNVSKTARVLGMHRRSLQYKLARLSAKR
ncbi:MAG: response regulator [Myxococcales bacterium]|nr:response regulator [Myxococcales bacterium]